MADQPSPGGFHSLPEYPGGQSDVEKTMMVALAAAVLAAFVLPVAASARWLHWTEQISEDATIEFTGIFRFESPTTGSMACPTKGEATLTALGGGTTGTINKFEVDLEAGKTTTERRTSAGVLSGCTAHSFVATGLPWTIHNNTVDVVATSAAIDTTFTGSFCPTTSATGKPTNLTLTPDNPHAVTSFSLGGFM